MSNRLHRSPIATIGSLLSTCQSCEIQIKFIQIFENAVSVDFDIYGGSCAACRSPDGPMFGGICISAKMRYSAGHCMFV